jgi:hypothetical protein
MSHASDTRADVRVLPHDVVIDQIIERAFEGSRKRFDRFIQTIREAIPSNVKVVLRGSAITGTRWADGKPFDDDGPGTSDLDLTLVGGNVLDFWRPDGFYIPGVHTAPLSDDAPDVAPVLVPLRKSLCEIARRPVNIQGTSNFVLYLRDVLFNQPHVTLIEGEGEGDERNESPAGEHIT